MTNLIRDLENMSINSFLEIMCTKIISNNTFLRYIRIGTLLLLQEIVKIPLESIVNIRTKIDIRLVVFILGNMIATIKVCNICLHNRFLMCPIQKQEALFHSYQVDYEKFQQRDGFFSC